MFAQLNERLADVKEKEKNKRKWQQRLEHYRQELKRERQIAESYRRQLEEEERDVEKLTGLSLSNLFHTLLGNKEDKLAEERREVVEYTLKYKQAAQTVDELEREVARLEEQLESVKFLDLEYEGIMAEKETLLKRAGGEQAAALIELSERRADLKAELKELDEAIHAGRSVIYALERARESLRSAKNWGTYDMLGGGMISTAVKHNRIDSAQTYIHEAQNKLRRFAKELQDIRMDVAIGIDTGGFLKFADYFFDGLVADWVVQGRISESLRQVEEKLEQAERLVGAVTGRKQEAEGRLREAERKYMSIVEGA